MIKQILNSIHIDNWNVSKKQACEDLYNNGIENLPMDELSNNNIETVILHAELKTVKLQFHAITRANKIYCKGLQ